MKDLFLTFDDGPSPTATPKVLDVLDAHGAKATFFVVAERARRNPALVREIQARGHSLGNHSLDHRYRHFFRSEAHVKRWILDAEAMLADLGVKPVGFRSPAGVHTPPLKRALKELGIPLIHWDVRFYDAVWPWTEGKALRSLGRTREGAIVLLHDAQPAHRIDDFLRILGIYLRSARGADFCPLPL